MAAHDMSACAFKRWNGLVERQLMQSGLAYTILRPTGFMQNFVNYDAARIAATGAIRAPLADARVSWIDVRDIAAVAAAVMSEDGHDGRVYDLSGPEALSHHEIAVTLSAATGQQIRYEQLSDAEWFRQMLSRGLPTSAVRSTLSLYQAYREADPGPVTGWVEILRAKAPGPLMPSPASTPTGSETPLRSKGSSKDQVSSATKRFSAIKLLRPIS